MMNAILWEIQMETMHRKAHRTARFAMLIPALFAMVSAAHAFQGGGGEDGDRTREFRYAVFEVPGLGGDFDEPAGINDLGHIVGDSVPAGERLVHPFFWNGNETVDLGTFGGTRGFANDVNNADWVVGSASYPGNQTSGAFLWKNGGDLIDLGNFGRQSGTAKAINERNQIVGSAGVEGGFFHAFFWEDGEMLDLGTLEGFGLSQAFDINENGYITGLSDSSDSRQSFLWDPNTQEMSRIGSLGDEPARNEAHGMNDDNVIVGAAAVANLGNTGARPYIFHDGKMYNLQKIYFVDKGFVGGWSQDVNNAGQVVGYINRRNEPNSFGFIFELGQGMRVLDDLLPPLTTWHVSGGQAINEHGQIAALARPKGDDIPFFRTLLLTPVNPELELIADAGPLRAGEINVFKVANATPGATITFVYGKEGGGARVPGCADLDAMLQINHPITIGTGVADGDGVATLETFIDPRGRNPQEPHAASLRRRELHGIATHSEADRLMRMMMHQQQRQAVDCCRVRINSWIG